jgi:hypothetical protein
MPLYDATNDFLNEAIGQQQPVSAFQCHALDGYCRSKAEDKVSSVLAWSVAKQESDGVPQNFTGIPGNEADFP